MYLIEDFYYDSDAMDSEEDFYDSDVQDVEDSGNGNSNTEGYIILKQERIEQLQEKDISEVCDLLSVSRGIACTLLLRQNWSLSSVVEKWLAGDDGVREVIALPEKPKLIEPENYCKICFESGDFLSLSCGHPFCADCWRSYLTSSINDGRECLNLRCPEPECKTAAGLDMVDSVSSDDDRNKYYDYLRRSYIECSRNRKWCPAPGCEYAGGCESYDVKCDCSYKFCWKCAEEWHRPVDCETVVNWMKKNNSEDASCTWISAYTKPCPKCERPIEKKFGCDHMTCEKLCGYEFCWSCLQRWSSSQLHWCNAHDQEQKVDTTTTITNMRAELEKYAHYYERWAANHKSRDIALLHMNRVKNKHVPILAQVNALEAWEQIVECRRVLKWTYAYGYYMDVVDKVKKSFFEYLQGEAESALERLHHCAENMDKYVEADTPFEDFGYFRSRLTTLTGVTRNCFQNLVKAMENNLSEVDHQVRDARTRKHYTSANANF